MFDCRVIKSYSHKKKRKKRVELWHTGLSERWKQRVPPTRRHPLVTPKATIKQKKSGRRRFPWLLTWKPKTASKDVPSWSSPKKFGWHVETYSTIKIKIFFFCYVLLLSRELGLSISSDFFRAKQLLFTPLVFLFNFLLRQFIFYLIFLLRQFIFYTHL